MTLSGAESAGTLDARTLARLAAEHALAKKAEHVVILDLTKLTSVCDYFVICHADSDVQVKAIVEAIDDGLERAGVRSWHIEGLEGKSWVLLDYVEVVVHVFIRDARDYYRLEDLWADAPHEDIEVAASSERAGSE